MDVQRIADGLWRWTAGAAGGVYYEAPDAVVLFDPLLPAGEEAKFLVYLDRDVERLGLPVSILLTDAQHERSAGLLRDRYSAGERLPASVEAYPMNGTTAYYIRPHRTLILAAPDLSTGAVGELPVELVLASNPARVG